MDGAAQRFPRPARGGARRLVRARARLDGLQPARHRRPGARRGGALQRGDVRRRRALGAGHRRLAERSTDAGCCGSRARWRWAPRRDVRAAARRGAGAARRARDRRVEPHRVGRLRRDARRGRRRRPAAARDDAVRRARSPRSRPPAQPSPRCSRPAPGGAVAGRAALAVIARLRGVAAAHVPRRRAAPACRVRGPTAARPGAAQPAPDRRELPRDGRRVWADAALRGAHRRAVRPAVGRRRRDRVHRRRARRARARGDAAAPQHPAAVLWPLLGLGMVAGWIAAPWGVAALVLAQAYSGFFLATFEGITDARVAAGESATSGLGWTASARALGSAVSRGARPRAASALVAERRVRRCVRPARRAARRAPSCWRRAPAAGCARPRPDPGTIRPWRACSEQIEAEARRPPRRRAVLADGAVAEALRAAAALVCRARRAVLAANRADCEAAAGRLDEGMLDRLRLDAGGSSALAAQLAALAAAPPLEREAGVAGRSRTVSSSPSGGSRSASSAPPSRRGRASRWTSRRSC